MSEPTTMTELAMRLSADGGPKPMIRAAVARALGNQEGHWHSEERRDAREVAEAACYIFLDEMKRALKDAERIMAFVRDSDTRPKDGDAQQGSARE